MFSVMYIEREPNGLKFYKTLFKSANYEECITQMTYALIAHRKALERNGDHFIAILDKAYNKVFPKGFPTWEL